MLDKLCSQATPQKKPLAIKKKVQKKKPDPAKANKAKGANNKTKMAALSERFFSRALSPEVREL